MADLTDDVSSLLHTLLHNSASSNNGHGHGPHPPGSADPVAFFDSDFGFSGGAYYTGAASASASASLAFDLDDINNSNTKAAAAAAAAAADCDDSEGQEETLRGNNPAPGSGRGSSKRTRAAEVHNLSEKRRRQRINEKLKALQKLIPNSNKTDKASMLDEAIEYLKQLQLQVQMLTMRNGTSLHPFCPPAGVGQLMNSPPIGALIDEANNNSRGISSFHPNPEGHMQTMFNLDSKPEPSLMPRMSENHNPGPSLILEPSMVYRPFSASIPSKVLCKDPAMPQLQLDMSRCGQSSSSGVST